MDLVSFRPRQCIALSIPGPLLAIFAERTRLAIRSARASFSSRAPLPALLSPPARPPITTAPALECRRPPWQPHARAPPHSQIHPTEATILLRLVAPGASVSSPTSPTNQPCQPSAEGAPRQRTLDATLTSTVAGNSATPPPAGPPLLPAPLH
ncbi:hypothetical protein PAHAL_9G539700 [Panicum hallii]|uniref:Uncharacterized protein n=1 Tax=Panicum hallii TaxID=206008 RepID=A0A2T8I5N8_9POAL|nr:hypothetical protein PAHAL_9G539700 [Panicum hallii]